MIFAGKPDRFADAAVLICTRNRQDALSKCVNSILCQTLLPAVLIIVDSSDHLGVEIAIREGVEAFGIALEYYRSAPGLALQRNIGVMAARNSVIVFLDDDTVLECLYIEGIMSVFERDSTKIVGGVQGSFVSKHTVRRLGLWFRRFFMLPGATGLGRMQPSGFPSYVDLPAEEIDVEVICGGNTAYRREVLGEFRWDERFKGYSYMEDDDFSYRVGKVYRLVQTPKALLIHEHVASGRDDAIKRVRMEVRNHALFFSLNMAKSLLTIFSFVWSEIGCSILTLRTHGLKALACRGVEYLRLRITLRRAIEKSLEN